MFNGKNRLFFMANFEGFKLRNQTQGVYNVPSIAMRGGNFSQLLPARHHRFHEQQSAIRRQYYSGRGPGSYFSGSWLEFYPAPNQPGSALSANYLSLQNNVTNKNQFTTRLELCGKLQVELVRPV